MESKVAESDLISSYECSANDRASRHHLLYATSVANEVDAGRKYLIDAWKEQAPVPVPASEGACRANVIS